MQHLHALMTVCTLLVCVAPGYAESLPDTSEAAQDTASAPPAGTANGWNGYAPGMFDESEMEEDSRKRPSTRFVLAGFGPGALRNVESDGVAYDFFAGRVWEINPRAAILALANVLTDFDQAALIEAGAGVRGYLLDAEVSPYGEVDFSFGYLRGNGRNTIGFVGGVSLGAQIFRTADTQISAGVRLNMLFRQLESEQGEEGFPYGYALRIGILF